MPTSIPAAGTLPWRRRRGILEVAVVHRPKYDDWSWAKGKLDPGEDWPVTAVRETLEETGLDVRLGRPLPPAQYPIISKDGATSSKVVRYWAAEVVGGRGTLEHEVDEVRWLSVQDAYGRLDYARDREQLLALVRAEQSATLLTWPLVIVRHAKAQSRADYRGANDRMRPLQPRGHERAQGLVDLLGAYGITALVSSPAIRCVDTLAPYAHRHHLELKTREGLSEEGFAAEPADAARQLAKVMERGNAAAVCSHGPVLPSLIEELSHHIDESKPAAASLHHLLKQAAAKKLVKGEALVAHLVGTAASARVVALERHLPARDKEAYYPSDDLPVAHV